MTAIFLYGSLLYKPLLKLVLGSDSDAVTVPARVRDHAVHWAEGGSFPLIVAASGTVAEGVVLTGLSGRDLQRLDYYEGGFAYQRLPVEAVTEAGSVQATVYFPEPGHWSPGAVWSLAGWQQRCGAMALRAAPEVMAGFGHIPAAEMATRRRSIEVSAASWVRAQAEDTPRDLRRDFSAANVEVSARRQPYGKFFSLKEQDLRFATFGGGQSAVVERAAFVSGDAVTVLPYDPERDRVLLVEQFRFGPLVRGDRYPWSLEPIAGRIDPGETPQQAAVRETREEAGLTLHQLEPVANYYPSPGAVSEYLISYIGIVDLPDNVAKIAGLESESEDIRGLLVSFDDLMAALQSGEAQNGPLILTALWLAANRGRLRARHTAGA